MLLVFLVVYLFGYISNMFCIPRYTHFHNLKAGYISAKMFNGPGHMVSYRSLAVIQLIDRSTLNTDASDALSIFPKCILLICMGLGILKVLKVLSSSTHDIFYYRRYSYLSFCTFRI